MTGQIACWAATTFSAGLLLADGGAAGRIVGVVTVHEAVVWSDAPLIRGAVSESAETAPALVPR